MSATIYVATYGFTINDDDKLPDDYKSKSHDEIIEEIDEAVHAALVKWHKGHPGVLEGDPV